MKLKESVKKWDDKKEISLNEEASITASSPAPAALK